MKTKISHWRRKSIRLEGYDYSQAGTYYITICTFLRESFFGHTENAKIILTPVGAIACKYWKEIPYHFQHADVDVFIIMPNHIHGLIQISDENKNVVAEHVQPESNDSKISSSIGSIIKQYKGSVTRWCKKNHYLDFKWQNNFYEHIVRNEKELNRIRQYIITNPLKWEYDRDNVASINFDMDLDEYYKDIYEHKAFWGSTC